MISSNRAMSSDKLIEEKPLQEEGEEDDDEIIVDENQPDEDEHEDEVAEEKQKSMTNNCRTANNHLRCRQCDYEADDLSDLLIHRKAHASLKSKAHFDRKHNSDIENDDQEHMHLANPSNQVCSDTRDNLRGLINTFAFSLLRTTKNYSSMVSIVLVSLTVY